MISTLLLTLVTPAVPSALPGPATYFQDDAASEFETRMAEAGDDVQKLWDLHLWCKSNAKSSDSRKVLKKIVEVDGTHEDARKALGHQFYDGQWFEGYLALSDYKRAEEKRMLEEKGLVRFGDGWAPKDDVPFLRMGWVKREDTGEWASKRKLDRKAEEERLQSEGYQQQDLTWIAPDEFGQWEQGLYKCGEEWKSPEEADAYHANPATPWTMPSEHFIVTSTCTRDTTYQAGWYADQIYKDLVRAYGAKPEEKPNFWVFNGITQYNNFASGQAGVGAELDGFSSCHYAFMADALVDRRQTPPEYVGTGMAYWDATDQNLASYGPLAARHAAAHAYAEQIDPSWNAISMAIGNNSQLQFGAFWNEKRVPRWFRYGVAAYAERFFKDDQSENPWWCRDWATEQIRVKGGYRPLEEIFRFTLDAANQEGSMLLIFESGMVMSFILDGECAPVIEKHQAFKATLKDKSLDSAAAVKELEQAIMDNREAFEMYVKMGTRTAQPAAAAEGAADGTAETTEAGTSGQSGQ